MITNIWHYMIGDMGIEFISYLEILIKITNNRIFENRKHFQDGGIIGFKIAICPESPFKR